MRWHYSRQALLDSNPLGGGSRDAFFVQLILAQAAGAPKGRGVPGLTAYLKVVGIDAEKLKNQPGLHTMIREACRVWSQLKAEFEQPGKGVDAMAKILTASTGQLSYLQNATRYHIKGRLRLLVATIKEADTRKARKFKWFCSAMDKAFVPREGVRSAGQRVRWGSE